MRVLHILGELKFSGAEIMLRAAKDKFKDAGLDIHILSTGGTEVGLFAPQLSGCGYTIHYIPFRKNIRFLYFFIALLRTQKFDIVHVHTERFFFFFILFSRVMGVKRIFRTIHSTFRFHGYLRLRRRVMLHLGGLIGCKYISISHGVYNNELNRYGVSSTIINNWIDTDHFLPGGRSSDPSILRLISVGSCSNVKQHFLILNLIKLLEQEGHSVIYHHLGTGELECEEKLLANSLQLRGSIYFEGNQNDVLPLLQKSDFFIMPSLYEGLSIATIEAMATGLIPIVNNVPGLRELVDHEINGLVVDFNNLASVSKALAVLNKSAHRMKELSAAARCKIVNSYSLANVNTLIKCYHLSTIHGK